MTSTTARGRTLREPRRDDDLADAAEYTWVAEGGAPSHPYEEEGPIPGKVVITI